MDSPSEVSKTAPSQELPPGTRLEEFIIERVLGSGGFGITYLATDKRLGRQVVIKENLPAQFCWRDTTTLTVQPRQSSGEDADNFQYSLESFEKEAATLASLDHPGIVKVLRSFEANGTAYFVMPFVEGTTFDEVIKERQTQGEHFTEEELTGLLWRVLEALAYLHERGIYYRDIKPGNILITADGDPVLIDFGAARQRLSELSLTVIESPGYTPFEQMQSRGKVGPWSDVYALGGTVYKAITGETPAKAADRILEDGLVPLVQRRELVGPFSQQLLQSIDRAMRPNLSERPQTAGEWLGLLQTQDSRSPTTPSDAAGRIEGSDLEPILDSSSRGIRRGTYLIALLCFLVVWWAVLVPNDYNEIWLFLAWIGLVGASYYRIKNMGWDPRFAFLVFVPLIGSLIVLMCTLDFAELGILDGVNKQESIERYVDPDSIEAKLNFMLSALIIFAFFCASLSSWGHFYRFIQSHF
jgi:serine/threonine protein kinase